MMLFNWFWKKRSMSKVIGLSGVQGAFIMLMLAIMPLFNAIFVTVVMWHWLIHGPFSLQVITLLFDLVMLLGVKWCTEGALRALETGDQDS